MKRISAEQVEAAVFSAVDRLKEVLPPEAQLDRSRGALLGDGTSLDSMAVVNLLVFIEEEILSALDIEIMLTGVEEDGGIDPEQLQTLGSLIDALCARVN
jgi:acyl carrier protein